MSPNEKAKQKRPTCSKKDLRLRPVRKDARRGYLFHGNQPDAQTGRNLGGQRGKYYIGNGNEAEMVSTLGKVKDGTDDYTFFVTNYRHKAYELKKNVISPSGICFQLRAS